MLKNRWLIVSITTALLVMVTMLIFQVVATAQVASASASPAFVTGSRAPATIACPYSAADIRSMQAEYVKETGIWLARSAQGYAGSDGGALALRDCPGRGK